jgi:hypothetical protein
MVWRIALFVWGLLGTAGVVLYAWGEQVPPDLLLQGLATLITLAAIWLVVKLPWDLYFAARYVQVSQAQSVGRQLAVPDTERLEASALAKRLLALCIGLHLTGALASGVLAYVLEGQLGWVAAGAFMVSMGIRPTAAMVFHVRRRLQELRQSSRIPRDDARTLDHRVKAIEASLAQRDREDVELGKTLQALVARVEQQRAALDHAQAQTGARLEQQDQRHKDDVERLCREFERSIEKLTSDQALLSGIRAFLTMVRQAPS